MAKYERLKATLQKSYYGKATLCRSNDGSVTLFSYQTDVAMIDGNGTFHRLWNGYSRTTAKHVNDFRIMHGLPTLSKKEWDALPVRGRNADPVYNVYVSTGFTTHKCPALLTRAEAEAEAERLQRARPHCIVWYE